MVFVCFFFFRKQSLAVRVTINPRVSYLIPHKIEIKISAAWYYITRGARPSWQQQSPYILQSISFLIYAHYTFRCFVSLFYRPRRFICATVDCPSSALVAAGAGCGYSRWATADDNNVSRAIRSAVGVQTERFVIDNRTKLPLRVFFFGKNSRGRLLIFIIRRFLLYPIIKIIVASSAHPIT